MFRGFESLTLRKEKGRFVCLSLLKQANRSFFSLNKMPSADCGFEVGSRSEVGVLESLSSVESLFLFFPLLPQLFQIAGCNNTGRQRDDGYAEDG